MLKLDWCSHQAAEYACLNWHYSKSMPAGKLVKIGVWEHGKYIGVIIFSRGATPHIGAPYKLTQYEICELTRVALTKHKYPVSKMLGVAIKMLKSSCPGIRLIVSYADADQNHSGGIYKATNWIYTGLNNVGSRGAFVVNGKKIHPRTIGAMGGIQSIAWVKKHLDANAKEFITKGKHKYLMPLDDEMRKVALALQKPYPK